MRWFRKTILMTLLLCLLLSCCSAQEAKEKFIVLGFVNRVEKLEDCIAYETKEDEFGWPQKIPTGVTGELIGKVGETVLVDSIVRSNKVTLLENNFIDNKNMIISNIEQGNIPKEQLKDYQYAVIGCLNNMTISEIKSGWGVVEGQNKQVRCNVTLKVYDLRKSKLVFTSLGIGTSDNLRYFCQALLSFGRKGVSGQSNYNAIEKAVLEASRKMLDAI